MYILKYVCIYICVYTRIYTYTYRYVYTLHCNSTSSSGPGHPGSP